MKQVKIDESRSHILINEILAIFIKNDIAYDAYHQAIKKLSICNKFFRRIIDQYYWNIKLFHINSAAFETQWILLQKRHENWNFNFHIPFNNVKTHASFIFVWGNRQFASLIHIRQAVTSTFCNLKGGPPGIMTSNWLEFYKKGEDGVIIFEFAKVLKKKD